MNLKRMNFRMFYLNERIIVYPMVIYGFQFSLVHHRIDSHVFNDVIEYGDEKSQKWLTSILNGLFLSIFITQPMKVLCLAIFFAFLF